MGLLARELGSSFPRTVIIGTRWKPGSGSIRALINATSGGTQIDGGRITGIHTQFASREAGIVQDDRWKS